jgi:hypothetical protein
MLLLGHRNIKKTQRYRQLTSFESSDYTCRGATTSEEAAKLVEGGLQHVCTVPENGLLFRKRK